MVRRKGLGKSKGQGYKNIIGNDSGIHSMSSKGIKQPQKIPNQLSRVEILKSKSTPFKTYSLAGDLVSELRDLNFDLSFTNERKQVFINHKNMEKPIIIKLSENDNWGSFFKKHLKELKEISNEKTLKNNDRKIKLKTRIKALSKFNALAFKEEKKMLEEELRGL